MSQAKPEKTKDDDERPCTYFDFFLLHLRLEHGFVTTLDLAVGLLRTHGLCELACATGKEVAADDADVCDELANLRVGHDE